MKYFASPSYPGEIWRVYSEDDGHCTIEFITSDNLEWRKPKPQSDEDYKSAWFADDFKEIQYSEQ